MSHKITLSIVFSLALIGGAYSVPFVQAQTDTAVSASGTVGITFPIPELGNCADKVSCRTFCNQTANIEACISFGKAHGLLNNEEAERGIKFALRLKESAGPGGCTTPDACEAYCSNVQNIETCVAFAKEAKLNTPKLEAADKLAAFIKSGGLMPGGCTSADSCRTYCGELAHLEECRTFAQKLGIRDEHGTTTAPGQLKKFLEVVKNGETPGGCTTAAQCKLYCQNSAHREECVAFAAKAELISKDDALRFLMIDGKGPGGCTTKEGCQTYCNDQAHREECFQFAKDNNLIESEKLQEMQRMLVTVRAGISDAPPEVAACLTSTLGENIINDIQAGTLTPGQEIGSRVKDCFEKFGKRADPKTIVRQIPSPILACVKEKLGTDAAAIIAGKIELTPETADAMRMCKELRRLETQDDNDDIATSTVRTQVRTTANQMVQNMPITVQKCLRERLGEKFNQAISGTIEITVVKENMGECMREFKPGRPATTTTNSVKGTVRPAQDVNTTSGVKMNSAPLINVPENVRACLQKNLSEADYKIMMNGTKSSVNAQAVINKCYELMRKNQTSPTNRANTPTGVFAPKPAGSVSQPTSAPKPKVIPRTSPTKVDSSTSVIIEPAPTPTPESPSSAVFRGVASAVIGFFSLLQGQ